MLAPYILLAALRSFVIDGNVSDAAAHVGKTGLFQVAGHEHRIVARNIQGEISLDADDLSKCTVDLIVNTRSLKVAEEGEPAGDAPKVQEAMRGPSVLDVGRFGTVHFGSTGVSGKQTGPGQYDLTVQGELSLHGVVKALAVPVHVEVAGTTLTATGKFQIRQSDFGIEPTTAAGGLVRVENEVALSFRIAAKAGP
jgi:polyisoprenoid-binding protein YceI